MKLVSVIIPTYNRGELIERSIQSVLKQTYTNLEVIVVDDCSTDDTRAIVKNIKDTRIKYIKLENNSGACVARNEGILRACGDYIAFQDSDDEWLPDKLKVQIETMEAENIQVSFCNFIKFNAENPKGENNSISIDPGFVDRLTLLKKSVVSTQCIVCKKECFESLRFDVNLPRLQDWDIIIELSKMFQIYHIDMPLVNMYVQNDSISRKPEKGYYAINYLWEKNKNDINNNKDIKRCWHIYRGNYLIEMGKIPTKDFKEALKINFTLNIFIKYMMCKLHVIVPIYRKRLNRS